MNECIPVDQLGTLKQLNADDARRRHAASCARCSSLLFAYEEFTRANERADANVPEAEMHLARFIAEQVGETPSVRVSGAPRRGRRWFDFSVLRMAAAVAAVLLVAVVIVRWQPWQSKEIVYRGEASAQFTGLVAAKDAGGRVDMHWDAVKNADSYRVTILAQDLGEITRLAPVTVLSAQVAPGSNAYYWQVTALLEGAEILTSDPQRLP